MWETLQLPLYTIWQTGTEPQRAFAAIHCTGGDFLIATSGLVLALVTVGHRDWPESHFKRVAAVAVALGLGYAIFSECLNVAVRGSWSLWLPLLLRELPESGQGWPFFDSRSICYPVAWVENHSIAF